MPLHRSTWTLLLIVACVVAAPSPPQAQSLRLFRYLTTDDGLPDMSIFAIQQDSQGYMWFATSVGLVRWDGYEFRSFSHRRTYGRHEIAALPKWLGQDGDGALLVGGAELAKIDSTGRLTKVFVPRDHVAWGDASGYEISGVYVTRSDPDVEWIGTAGAGLIRWDRATDSVRVFLPEPGNPLSIPSRYVAVPFEDSTGDLWVPTEAGLVLLDRTNIRFHRMTSRHVIAVLEDRRHPGVLWLAERGGVSRFDVSSRVRETVIEYGKIDVPDPPARFFAYDAMPRSMIWDRGKAGVLWIAANTAGLYRYDTESGGVEHYVSYREVGHRGSFLSGYPSCVFQDRSGILWFGTYGAGVTYADPASGYQERVNASRLIQPQYKKPSGEVTAVTEDRLGRWWVGTRDSRRHLLMIDRQTGEERRWFGAPSDDGDRVIPFGDVQAIVEDSHGDIWIGEVHVDYADSTGSTGWKVWEEGALYRLRLPEERFQSYRHDPYDPHSLPQGGIVSLFKDVDGTIWAGTRNHGIARVDPESGEITTVNIPEASNSPWGFLQDQSGRVWVGTHDGVCLLDRESRSCRIFPLPVRRDYNTVELAERPSEPGVLWVGTWSGLFRFDTEKETFSRPVKSGLLTTMHIVDIVADAYSSLWLATDGDGLFRFEPETGALTALDLRQRYYGLGAGMLTSKGEVVFGTQGLGLRVFDSSRTYSHTTPPPILIQRLVGSRTGIHEFGPSERSLQVRLESANESFSVEYVALDYSDPSRNEYAYRLEGLQDEWQYVGTAHRATFSGLDPGEYTFLVKGASSYGIWSESNAALRVIVPPPWWRTGWAYALYVLFILSVLFATERLRHASIVRRERHRAALRETEIRSEVAEAKAIQASEHAGRLKELDESKSRFFANVSHEFRTPLTLILGAAEEIEAGRFGRPTEGLRKAVGLIVRNAKRVDGLVRELLDLSRLESSTLQLVRKRADLAGAVRAAVRSHTPLAERAQVDLRFHGPDDRVIATFDAARLETAVGNLISNAIKFTDSGGKVEVSLGKYENREGDVARIDVRDTGVGIKEEDLGHVFDRFHQIDTSPTRRREGIGIGLAVVRELVELHGGRVEVVSELGVGSMFAIHLPLRGEEAGTDLPREIVATTGRPIDRDAATDAEVETKPASVRGNGSSAVDPVLRPKGRRPRESSNRPLVLIVEDNADVRAFLKDHFAPEFEVLEAKDGSEGLRMTRDYRPELVVSDVMMPEMDGIAMCRAIKEDSKLRNTPIILVTARAGEEEALEGLRAGADEYITKPFSVAVLLQLVKNVIESRAQVRTDSLRKVLVEPAAVTVESQDESLLRRVVTIVEDHMGDAFFTVDMLADEVGLSRRQLERRLPEACGESPSELVRRMRLERARQLLEADVGTVAEITNSTGYRSASRFASAFRRAYGLTPSQYRRSKNGA